MEAKSKPSCPCIKIDTARSYDKVDLLRNIIKRNNWVETMKDSDIIWKSREIHGEDIARLQGSKTLINHYPNPERFSNKRVLSLILRTAKNYFPEDFEFYPTTYLYPDDAESLEKALDKNEKSRKNTFILKPSEGSEGIGIQLFQTKRELVRDVFTNTESVIQKYIKDPLLLDGKKFDIRAYVLILGVNPMEAFISAEGLARFCTEEYKTPSAENMKQMLSHLTNYSLNKESAKFIASEEILDANNDSKRTLASLYKSLEELGVDSKKIEEGMHELTAKTLVALEPFITQEYYSVFGNKQRMKCFSILGFDILLDKNYKPWLLEINAFPSLKIHNEKLRTIAPVDEYVKTLAVENALKIAMLRKQGKKLNDYACYRRLLPAGSLDKYGMLRKVNGVFTRLQQSKVSGRINQSRFALLGSMIDQKVSGMEKYDYSLVFTKVMKFGKEMDLALFMRALEVLAERIFKGGADGSEKLIKLIESISLS